eukprot:CAMPEP_0177756480 /NCGR_PEP_ID=MMETSP0491_2-20121128/3128_1 /TAXON_ID=63592 /ORGANISM="Tetraselmis chuii, Strain PLY429" /LENGTH=158 /DNA_ID=CAMNT_0019272059 /DNA_START=54 /DNA_END=530 /DNA_ORIENTATION=-
MYSCWNFEPGNRPSFAELLVQLRFFRETAAEDGNHDESPANEGAPSIEGGGGVSHQANARGGVGCGDDVYEFNLEEEEDDYLPPGQPYGTATARVMSFASSADGDHEGEGDRLADRRPPTDVVNGMIAPHHHYRGHEHQQQSQQPLRPHAILRMEDIE